MLMYPITNIFLFYLQELKQLKWHKKAAHVDKTKLDFKCEKCDFASYAKRYVLLHFRKVHCDPKYPNKVCEYCGKKFLFPVQLKKHHEVHHVIISLLRF